MKRFVVILVLFVLSAMIFCFAGLAFAEETDIKVTLDGEILTFDQNPIIQNERVLVPLRKIFESLSAEVSWDPGTQTITVVKAGTTVNLTVGLPEAYINDSLLTLDQPPVIVNDRTLVPIRFVSEALGAKVDWDAASRTVRINSEPEASQLDAGENYKKGLAELDLEKKISYFTRAIELDPELVGVYVVRGNAYDNMGQPEKAIADYNKAIGLNPEYVFAYYNRGITFYYLGRYEEAIADYNKSIALDPQYVDAYHNRGIAYGMLDQYDKAIADYNKSVALDPGHLDSYLERGNTYLMLLRYDMALADFNKVIELDPTHYTAFYSRGLIYSEMGQYDKAIDDYSKTVELEPKFAYLVYQERAVAYQEMGQIDQAIADYKKILLLDPANAEAKLALHDLGVAGY